MSDETLRNEADTPPSQELATAIPANPANEQEPVSFEQYKDKAVLPEEDLENAVKRLAAMKKLDYVQVRKATAKRYDIPAGMLDDLIKEAQQESEKTSDDMFAEIEPWPEPVKGAELLNKIEQTIRRFIVCEPETARAAALWIVMTWLIDVVKVAPLAVITAPEKRCGKTQLLDLIGKMSYRPMSTSSITPSALFRSIEMWQPTLLIDEADAFINDNEEMRGLLNAGHSRTSAFTIRTVGDDHTPKRFNVWGAKAIAGIGKLQDTVMDRSITLELRRKLDCEHVDRIRHAEPGLFETLCRKLCRFAEDNRETIRNARPSLPEELNDRAQDNWEPLLSIADTAGGEWPEKAIAAALKISGDNQSAQSIGTELLSDIKEVFDEKNVSKLFTSDLIAALCEDSEKPWDTYNRGKPISPRQLSNRLKEYGIKSKDIRIGYENKKGFEKSQFEDAFNRYIHTQPEPPVLSATPRQTSAGAGYSVAPLSRVTHTSATNEKNSQPENCRGDICLPESVTDSNATRDTSATRKPSTGAGCHGVADRKGVSGKVFFDNEGEIGTVTI